MPKTKSILKEVEKVIKLKTSEAFNPQEFYKGNRKGLYIWSDFRERILPKAKLTKKGASFEIASSDLAEYANDEQIEKSLPKRHLFSESEVSAIIAELIAKQPNGEKGDLVNTGRANLFYTKAFVVSVIWRGFGGVWRVYAWHRGSGGWSAGRRVFSPAN